MVTPLPPPFRHQPSPSLPPLCWLSLLLLLLLPLLLFLPHCQAKSLVPEFIHPYPPLLYPSLPSPAAYFHDLRIHPPLSAIPPTPSTSLTSRPSNSPGNSLSDRAGPIYPTFLPGDDKGEGRDHDWGVGGNSSQEDLWEEAPEVVEGVWESPGNDSGSGGGGARSDAAEVWLIIVKALVMGSIILVSVMGNILVIVSVGLHRSLHSPANYLLVSLATADMLVALFAMTFNASVELTGGRWLFGRWMCDLWNSFDVYFSTVSILHLCCISVDRYYAIVRPLEYPLTITRRILAIMLGHCWLAPALISFVPILLGWYTTADHLRAREATPQICTFVVNAVFALVSSAVSFWIPCTVMVVMYFRIFQEARKQERALLSRASSANSAAYNHSQRRAAAAAAQQQQQQQQQLQQQQGTGPGGVSRQQLVVALQGPPATPTPRYQQEFRMKTFSNASSMMSLATTTSALPPADPIAGSSGGDTLTAGNGTGAGLTLKPGGANGGIGGRWRHGRYCHHSWHGPQRQTGHPCGRRLHSTSLHAAKTSPILLGRREHKAARTLGLIMGAFVVCWLPFFVWYVSITVCGPTCRCPHAVVSTLFWIGYFNSTLNPFIYAYFRADFREAFHRTLKRLRCCRPRQPAGVFV